MSKTATGKATTKGENGTAVEATLASAGSATVPMGPSAWSVALAAWVSWRVGTLDDHAEYLGVTVRTLCRWKDGEWQPRTDRRREGDVTRADVERLTDGFVRAEYCDLPTSAVRLTSSRTIERFPGGAELLAADRLTVREEKEGRAE